MDLAHSNRRLLTHQTLLSYLEEHTESKQPKGPFLQILEKENKSNFQYSELPILEKKESKTVLGYRRTTFEQTFLFHQS